MLLTDDVLISQADLVTVDSEVTDVATAESITIDGTNGLSWKAHGECADFLLSAMQSFGGPLGGPTISGTHLAHVYNTGGGYAVRIPRIQRHQIVTHSPLNASLWSPLKRWAIQKALVLFYRSAFNRNVNDRYASKLEEYERALRMDYWPALKSNGLPVVVTPLSAPAAVFEPNSGTWSASNLSSVPGGATAQTAYYVAITYTGSGYVSASSKGNAESAPSQKLQFTVPLDELLKIDITSLVPPTGAQDPSTLVYGAYSPMAATGWNVYVGSNDTDLYLQNASPIAIATKTYTLSAAPTLSGTRLQLGQFPDLYQHFSDLIARG